MSIAQRNWWLNHYFRGQDMNLSERITALRFQEQVAETIRINMNAGLKLVSLTKEVSQYTTGEDVAGWVRDVERAGRLASAGNMTAMIEFKSTITSMKAEILDNLEAGNATKLQKAYLKVIKAAENMSEDGLDKAIENAIEKKALYNAFRIAQTETNRAYNMGAYTRALADPDAEAMQLDLSYIGNNCDECTDLAEQDNGAGQGVYPFDQVPETPIHPNCRCILSPVYRLPDGIDAEDMEVEGDFEKMEKMPDELAA